MRSFAHCLLGTRMAAAAALVTSGDNGIESAREIRAPANSTATPTSSRCRTPPCQACPVPCRTQDASRHVVSTKLSRTLCVCQFADSPCASAAGLRTRTGPWGAQGPGAYGAFRHMNMLDGPCIGSSVMKSRRPHVAKYYKASLIFQLINLHFGTLFSNAGRCIRLV